MDIREIWLKAADSLVAEYFKPDENDGFDAVSVLAALEHTADALYNIDHKLSLFIAEETRAWYYNGMKSQVNFYDAWVRRPAKQS
ncbi:hypothetical protein [Serratia marcescens]|uniref:hypothetical protein n=1 Tax=Serratia marcescens TaxID=615 RepID=UPI003EE12220